MCSKRQRNSIADQKHIETPRILQIVDSFAEKRNQSFQFLNAGVDLTIYSSAYKNTSGVARNGNAAHASDSRSLHVCSYCDEPCDPSVTKLFGCHVKVGP